MRGMGRAAFVCWVPCCIRLDNGVMKDDLNGLHESPNGFHGTDADQIKLG